MNSGLGPTLKSDSLIRKKTIPYVTQPATRTWNTNCMHLGIKRGERNVTLVLESILAIFWNYGGCQWSLLRVWTKMTLPDIIEEGREWFNSDFPKKKDLPGRDSKLRSCLHISGN